MAKTTRNNRVEYHRRICRAIDFINTHLTESPSVDEIARAAPFSSFHFQRLFRAIIGETVGEFTRRLRLEAVARSLRFRPESEITRLAFDFGFSSSQNFAKAFKKHFGVTASQYRENGGNVADSDSLASSTFDHRRVQVALQNRPIVESVEIRELSSFRVAYRRHFGSYNDHGVQVAFDELARWAKPRDYDQLERYLGIPWDDSDVTSEAKCRFDACLIVPDEVRHDRDTNSQTIQRGRYAVYRCNVIANDFDSPWTQLMRDWLPDSGFQPADGPRFEKYLTDGSRDPDGCWLMEAFLPVRLL